MSEQTVTRPAKAARSRDPVRDGLIILCMTVVALALGIGLHLQFNLAFWLAVVAALAVYVALLSAHVLIRRSEHVDALQQEVARLEARLGRPQSATSPSRTASPERDMPAPASTSMPVLAPVPKAAGRVEVRAPEEVPPAPAPSGPAGSLEDYWSFKPTQARLSDTSAPAIETGASSAVRPAAAAYEPPAAAAPRAARDAVVERTAEAEQIDAVIKKIAADITQGQARQQQEALVIAPPSLAATSPVPVDSAQVEAEALAVANRAIPPTPPQATGRTIVPPPLPPAVSAEVAADIDESVAALHAAADAMREAGRHFEQARVERADPDLAAAGRTAPPPLPRFKTAPDGDPARARLALVAEALERERFDVLLQPILGLADRRALHYVVLVRMRDGIGGDTSSFATTGFAPGSGLLPLLDAAKVESAARVAWRMEDRNKSGSLFSQLSGESLVSDRFLNRFADTYRQGDTLGSRLVLSFRQAEVRLFSELQWATLRDMADLGFRFCLEEITDLDIDLAALVAAGFTFIKLDAAVFFEGLMAEGGILPAADICQYFASLNLTVIVGGISDEEAAATLQSYGVQLGLGDLYGAPRAVKPDVLRNPHAAAVA